MHDHRMIGRTPLDLENLAYGGGIGGIRAEPIDGLGREYHQFAGAQGLDGFFDFSLCRSYHGRMISRLRYQQRSLTLRIHRSVPQCRFSLNRYDFALLHRGINCRRKDTLHEYQVEPSPELECHLMEMTHAGESKTAVQADRHHVI